MLLKFCLVFALSTIHLGRHVLVSDDYVKAEQIAQSFDKPMLLLFTGSDWSDESQTFLKSILPSRSFYDTLKKDFVLTQVDFPELSMQTAEKIERNHALKERFHVQAFPTLLLTDSHGNEITRTGLFTKAPEPFAEHLKAQLRRYHQIKQALQMEDLPIEQLKLCYSDAKELGCEHLSERILERGLQNSVDPYFHIEKYVELLHAKSASASELKADILKIDPENRFGSHYRLAILDFQSQDACHPKEAIEPLITYIDQYGDKDLEHLWQLHMMIAQYLFSRAERDLALQHARKCYQTAPSFVKDKALQTIEFMRAHAHSS